MTAIGEPTRTTTKPEPARLGEELPIFCEKCGYSLHGLPQTRCEHCDILHFICPECGHHQPINTLRPAVQRFLGRLRAVGLVAIVFFKLNFFGWLAFAWFAMGVEWIYTYRGSNNGTYTTPLRELNWEMFFAFVLFAIPYSVVARMLLLRWRRGILVGLVLAGQVWALVTLGAWFRAFIDLDRSLLVEPLGTSMDYFVLAGCTCAAIVVGSSLAWPIWTVLVRAFLPQQTAHMLLEWQRSHSDRSGSGLARA